MKNIGKNKSVSVYVNGVFNIPNYTTDLTGYATETYVNTQVSNLVDAAPTTLNTLNELAAALGDDANFSTTVTNSIATKLPLAGGTMTGNIVMSGSETVDGRDLSADGSKLDGIESGATADQTAAEIRTLVDSASDSNVFTDADHTKLDGIEASATADQTAAEILTAIKTVDGSGSGLDADTVDGIQASSFLRSDANDVLNGTLSYHSNTARLQFRNASYNTYLYIGGWSSSNSAGVSRIRCSNDNLHIDSGSNGNLHLNNYSSGNTYIRGQMAWHAGNDGSGSGLDADLLDGQQGSHYLNYNNLTNKPAAGMSAALAWFGHSSGC